MAKLLHFLSPYKKRVALMLLLLFGQTLGTLYIPTLTASIVNNGIVAGDLGYVWKTGGFMLLVAFLTVAVSISGTYTSTYISTAMGCDIRKSLFRKVQKFSVNDFNQFGAASLITRSTKRCNTAANGIFRYCRNAVARPFYDSGRIDTGVFKKRFSFFCSVRFYGSYSIAYSFDWKRCDSDF